MTCKQDVHEMIGRLYGGDVLTTERVHHELGTYHNSTINKALHDLYVDGLIGRVCRGVYFKRGYLLNTNVEVYPHSDMLIEYLWLTGPEDRVIGYESGPRLAAEVGLQTMLPARRNFYTNAYRRHRDVAKELRINL